MLAAILLATLSAEGRDRDKNFGRGRGGPWHGNERSERPGRVPVGRPQAGGNGCPAGTMRVVFAPDNLSFSILFDQFVAESQGGKNQKRDVMTCDMIIPIEIPSGLQMEITRVDYRGFVSLPERSSARLHTLFNFRGRGGDGNRLNLRFNFQGPVLDNYVISTDLLNDGNNSTNPEVSPCGGTTNLRVYNQLTLQVRSKNTDAAQVTVDSIDGEANAVYYVNWRACQTAPRRHE